MWGKVMVIFPSSSPDCRFVRRRGQRWLPLVALMLLWLDASAAGESWPIHHDDFNTSQRNIAARSARMGDGRVNPAQGLQMPDGFPMVLAQAQEPKAPTGAKPAQPETSPPNRGMVQLLNQVEALNGELSRLRGQIEVLANDVNNAQKRQRDMYVDLDTRLRRIEQNSASKKDQETIAALEERIRRLEQGSATPATIPQPVSSATVVSPVNPPSPATSAPTAAVSASTAAAGAAVPSSAAGTGTSTAAAATLPPASLTATDQAAIQRAYDNAYSNYRLSDYPGAIRGFEIFLKTYPKHSLAPNAQYWIGESYFHLKDYRAAIEAQRRLVGTYPDSTKSPDALLIIGTAENNLGDTPAARKTLEELIAKYPSSDAADKAKGRLARLK
jgi:tol-pal system protein YbgF